MTETAEAKHTPGPWKLLMRRDRTTIQSTADQIDMDLYRLADRIDQLTEMVGRGKRSLERDLIDAARSVSSARGAVRKHMHECDRVRTA